MSIIFVPPSLGSSLGTATVTSSPAVMVPNMRYVSNGATRLIFLLPTTANIGDQFPIRGQGVGGWTITQNAGQTIHGSQNTTTGTGGSVSSQTRYDCVNIECTVANTEFNFINKQGTLTIV